MTLENIPKAEIQKLTAPASHPTLTALASHPAVTAAPLQERIRSDGEILADKTGSILAGKRLYLALDNASFKISFNDRFVVLDEHNFRHTMKNDPKEPVDAILTNSLLSITDSATLLRALPELHKDVLIIENPADMDGHFEEFEKGLMAFRKANPEAVVISGFPVPPVNTVQIESLQKAGLIDYVDDRPNASTTSLLGEAAILIESNAAMRARAEARAAQDVFPLPSPPPITEPLRN